MSEERPGASVLQVPVSGMSCQACAAKVERTLQALPGVTRAEVNFGSRTATLEIDPARLGTEELRSALRPLGYDVPPGVLGERDIAEDLAFAEQAERRDRSRLSVELLVAAVFSTATLLAPSEPAWLAPLLSAPVLLLAGWRIHRSGLRALVHGAPDMNSLVSLGTSTAWISALVPAGHAYGLGHAHDAVLVLAFVLFGRWLEARLRQRASGALRALLDLAPPRARVLRRGVEVEVALEELHQGSLVLVRPGERIPVDGRILEGRAGIDQAHWTGESFPAELGAGDEVRAGSLVLDGMLTITATGVGRESSLGRIAEAVRRAQGSRPSIQRLADRASAVFVPLVLAVAGLTFGGWLVAGSGAAVALAHAVAVLVIACPCALGLATPMAIVAATGRAAKEGLLVRDAEVFERLACVDTVLFDKTGTLTLGRPSLASVALAAGTRDESALLATCAAVEDASEQPLARAIVEEARRRGLVLGRASAFRAHPGAGVEARVGGRAVWIGSPRSARERGADPAVLEPLCAPLFDRGESVVVALVDGEVAGVLGFRDELRPGAREAVRELREAGLSVEVLSGDHAGAVRRAARELGLEQAQGELVPAAKAARVEELGRSGRHTLFVGDGINDAPALAAASVGMALGRGAELALQASDAALLRDEPGLVPRALVLARHTLRIARGNLVWAFAYNLLALPLATGVLAHWTGFHVSARWAGAAMAASSVAVVLNSLRLRSLTLRAPG